MKAESGKTYALVQDGKVQQIFTIAELPEWHDAMDVRDITGQDVAVGWVDVNGTLQAPVDPPVDVNAQILAAINVIETTKQPRAIREAVLNQPGAADRLANIDAEIAALRALLVK